MCAPRAYLRLIFTIVLLLHTGALSFAHAHQQQNSATIISEERTRGVTLYKQGDAEGAIRELQVAVKKHKEDADAWYFLGLALNHNNNAKQARKAFEEAVKLRPDVANIHTGLAFALMLSNKFNDSLREANRALSLDPQNAEAHYVYGYASFHQGQKKLALKEVETTLQLKPNFTLALFLKSQVLASIYFDDADAVFVESDQERYLKIKEAADSLEQFLKASPKLENRDVWLEQLDTLRFYEELADKTRPAEKRTVFRPSEVDTKPRILSRPEPTYNDEARMNGVSGTVVLRAVLAADGLVKHIVVIRPLSYGLTEGAIKAARRIKFLPATKDGRPVSQFIQIEYSFNVY